MKLSVVIPHRKGSDCKVTLDSLAKQTFKDFKIIMVEDTDKKGANWARNEGFKQVDTEYVLFSDDDINWMPYALETLYNALQGTLASYSYGHFNVNVNGEYGLTEADREFDPHLLLERNFISTMSMIRSADFLGFDESIKRFQDWDLWLTMLRQGMEGVYCRKLIFTTEERMGITNTVPLDESVAVIKKKHLL